MTSPVEMRSVSVNGFILFLRLAGKMRSMTKTLTAEVQHHNAERQLFGARRALAHLVEMYEKG